MSYRDELEASLARTKALERELSAKDDEIARLRSGAMEASPMAQEQPVKAASPPHKRSAHYERPANYFPLFPMFLQVATRAFSLCKTIALKAPTTDVVVFWIVLQCARPIALVFRGLAYVALVALYFPVAGINVAFYSLLLLPFLLLSGFRFTGSRPKRQRTWLDGRASEDEIEFVAFFSVMPPICFPGVYALIGVSTLLFG